MVNERILAGMFEWRPKRGYQHGGLNSSLKEADVSMKAEMVQVRMLAWVVEMGRRCSLATIKLPHNHPL